MISKGRHYHFSFLSTRNGKQDRESVMKQKLKRQFGLHKMLKQFVVIGLFVWLVACTGQTIDREPSGTNQIAQLQITEIVTPTEALESTRLTEVPPTKTATPTMTHEPTKTPKPTETATLSVTPTVTATRLSVDQLRLLRQLLVPDEKCQLPCWWGLNIKIDGKEDVAQFMVAQQVERYLESSEFPQYSYAGFRYDANPVTDVDITFFSDPTLRKIRISLRPPREENARTQFYQDWSAFYTPGNFIEYVGKPDIVMLSTFGAHEPEAEIILLYESLGMEMRYEIRNVQILTNGQLQICLLEEQMRNVHLFILDTDHMDPNDSGLALYHPERYEGREWETRTGTSLEHFYEGVGSDMPCFVYPR